MAHETKGMPVLRWLIIALRWLKYLLDLSVVGAFGYLLYFYFEYKVAYLNKIYGRAVGCTDCFRDSILAHDGGMLGLAVLLFFLSLWMRHYIIGVFIRIVALLLAAAFIFDIIIFENFTVRLNPSDFFVYGEQFSLIWDHLESTVENFRVIFFLSLAGVLTAIFFPSPRGGKPLWLALPGVLILAFSVYAHIKEPDSYVHDWAMRNVIANMYSQGVTVSFSEDYAQSLLERPDPLSFGLEQCSMDSAEKPDVVLLILESWSPWQSALWGGVGNDWTPKLDQLARENLWFSNMYAAGFTTNEGLMSLFNSSAFFSPIKSYLSIGTPFEAHWDWEHTLPSVMSREGYHSAFLTSGDLDFSLKGDWLDNIGFDYSEGHDFPGYEGLPRSHFRSAPDDALYQRSIDYYEQHHATSDQPLFLAIENVSTHHPYIHPYSKKRDAEAVFRYMDDTAYAFYEQLRQTGFFDRGGKMVVVSDHRTMTPITHEEINAFGRSAASRIPAFIVANDIEPREVNTLTHQSDILPSLVTHITGEDCINKPFVNVFEPDSSEEQCVLHARGDNRDHIDVFCPAGAEGRIRLNGDDTRFVESEGISPDERARLVEHVNRTRLEFQRRHEQYIQSRY